MPRVGNRFFRPLYQKKAVAQKLRDLKVPVREIARRLKVSKSWVAENTEKK